MSVTAPPPSELVPRERILRGPAPEVDLPALPPEVGPPAPERALEPRGWPETAGQPGRVGTFSSPSRALRLAPWLLLGVFLAVELAICFAQLTGPFLDEGIYVTAGLRTLQGHGIADNYLGWFSGSLLWPVIAALGWKLAGLAGARAAAALCVSAGLAGMVGATGNLLGRAHARVRRAGRRDERPGDRARAPRGLRHRRGRLHRRRLLGGERVPAPRRPRVAGRCGAVLRAGRPVEVPGAGLHRARRWRC